MNRKKLLLAEDDEDDRAFFHNVVKTRTDVALLALTVNGEEVFEILSAGSDQELPDLILLDQNMPRLNGIETLKMLKECIKYRNIPVFIYSTYADEGLSQLSREAGAASIFSKPYTEEGYNNMLDSMLELLK